jgi:hypothetical protein
MQLHKDSEILIKAALFQLITTFSSHSGRGSGEKIMDLTTTDRRRNRRYELRLPLQYQVAEKGTLPRTGTGNTCDLSSSGLSFRCRRPLPVGAHIEMTIDWPSKYGDMYPIELLVTGFIVRSLGGKIGVRVTSRKFHVDTVLEQPYRATA